jgi:hypothetical protein
VSISGIQSSGFDLTFAYKFKVYFGLFKERKKEDLLLMIDHHVRV